MIWLNATYNYMIWVFLNHNLKRSSHDFASNKFLDIKYLLVCHIKIWSFYQLYTGTEYSLQLLEQEKRDNSLNKNLN